MCEIDDHAFTLEVDIVKFDPESERILMKGFLGAINEISHRENLLIIEGDEASISLRINIEELAAILDSEKE
jgi:hypothetical protein